MLLGRDAVDVVKHDWSKQMLVLSVISGELRWSLKTGCTLWEDLRFATEALNTRKKCCSAWSFPIYIGTGLVYLNFHGKRSLILSGIIGAQIRIA